MKKKVLAFLCVGILAMGLCAGCGDSGSGSAGSDTAGDSGASIGEATTVTISINCATILDNMDQLDPAKAEFVPEDGWILEPVEVEIEAGDSVFDVLQAVCKENKIHMEHNTTPGIGAVYIEGMAQLYEFDCGELSGWNFCVDDAVESYGCDSIKLEGGEVIEWLYSCDLGRDLGKDVNFEE